MEKLDVSTKTVILAVGDTMQGDPKALKFPEFEKICYVGFLDVTSETLDRINPALILSPLLCNSFDCLELALRLQQLEYGGKYRVVAPKLTNPNMVKTEIRNQTPGLDFEIITTNVGDMQLVE